MGPLDGLRMGTWASGEGRGGGGPQANLSCSHNRTLMQTCEQEIGKAPLAQGGPGWPPGEGRRRSILCLLLAPASPLLALLYGNTVP